MPDAASALTDRLREVLLAQAQAGAVIGYRDLAARLGLQPPQVIRQLTEALEALMAADAAAGRPFLAALCVSRLGQGLPARGFFLAAAALGRFAGDADGPEARAFHGAELARLLAAQRRAGLITSRSGGASGISR